MTNTKNTNWKQESPYIFESPDGGQTVYGRLPGSTTRVLLSQSHSVDYFDSFKWKDIIRESKTNETLADLINKVEMTYALIKKEKLK